MWQEDLAILFEPYDVDQASCLRSPQPCIGNFHQSFEIAIDSQARTHKIDLSWCISSHTLIFLPQTANFNMTPQYT